MFVGAYLCTGAILLVLGAVVLVWRSRRRTPLSDARISWLGYLLRSGAILLTALILFIALSVALGIMQFGSVESWNYPQDYLAGGPIAWLVMLLPLLGLLAPLVLALLSPKRSVGSDAPARDV